MSFNAKADEISVVSIKLTDKGREFLAKGFKDDNVFDIVKFSLGDSEIDYTLNVIGDDSEILAQELTEPTNNPVDLKSKIYAAGVVPNGLATINLSTSSVEMTTYQAGVGISVSTQWEPVDGIYLESYSWVNLGPLEDYDFGISMSYDTRAITLRTYDTVGTTTIRVKGETSNKYALLTLTIS